MAIIMNTTPDRLSTAQIEEETLARLKQLAPGLEVLDTRTQVDRGDLQADLVVDIRFGTKRKTLLMNLNSSGEPAFLHKAASQLHLASVRWPNSYPVVVAPYVSPRGREILRQSRVGFLDLVGNCLLEFDGVYIERVEAAKPPAVRRRQRSLFAPVSSRIHRVLLENAERRWKLRDLAQEADMSIGLVHRVVQRLLDETFLERQDRLLVLRDPAGLLAAWREAYEYSQNSIRVYHAAARTPKQLMQRIAEAARQMPGRYAFTLHAGASLVAPFVRFTDVHVYTDEPAEAWIDALGLREVEFGGNLSLIQPYDAGLYYRAREVDGAIVVGDIQLYLDLYHYPARGREQADFLRQRRLKF
jgi:AraC-like DNA-binding protein